MIDISRRNFFRRSLQGSAGLAGAFAFSEVFQAQVKAPVEIASSSLHSGKYLKLHAGFQDHLVSESGQPMSDGYATPERPDGMGCFDLGDGRMVLMRNHEIFMESCPKGLESFAYDPTFGGGVTRLVFDAEMNLLKSHYALVGTAVNCAGGISPWGWLSCEEAFSRKHGFVFLCDPFAESIQMPQRIAAYGKFVHEAAVVNPISKIAYMTEDQVDSCFYRFIPDAKGALPTDAFQMGDSKPGGRLQALALADADQRGSFDVNKIASGDSLAAVWIDLPNFKNDPAAVKDVLRSEAIKQGALVFRRGEGLWLHKGVVYFSATSGGREGQGQIFSVKLSEEKKDGLTSENLCELRLLAQAVDHNISAPDNITIGPNGCLYICEDNGSGNHIYVLKPNGQSILLARNDRSSSEFAGACFDPTGQHLFVNLQEEGLTLRITGDFSQF